MKPHSAARLPNTASPLLLRRVRLAAE